MIKFKKTILPESAMKRAEEMRKKQIASIRKRMAKLEAMTFVAPNEKLTGVAKRSPS